MKEDTSEGMNEVIVFIGDVHGDWETLEDLISYHIESSMLKGYKIKKFIQVGDFGYYPKVFKNQYLKTPKYKDGYQSQYLAIRGNHEDHDLWLMKCPPFAGVVKGDAWMGDWHLVGDGHIDCDGLLYIGGARSLESDKQYRIMVQHALASRGVEMDSPWFPNEELEDSFWNRLFQMDLSGVRGVVTHDCRDSYVGVIHRQVLQLSRTGAWLDKLKQKLPEDVFWIHGHHHVFLTDEHKRHISLDMLDGDVSSCSWIYEL